MGGDERTLLLIQNKALAEQGTRAAENPETRFYPTGIHRSRLLAWAGIAAGLVLLAVLVGSLLLGG